MWAVVVHGDHPRVGNDLDDDDAVCTHERKSNLTNSNTIKVGKVNSLIEFKTSLVQTWHLADLI